MTQPNHEPRSRNYPIRVDVPLGVHMLEVFDHVERTRRIIKKLDAIVTSQLGLTAQTKILQLTPGNMTDLNGGAQTYDIAVLGVFFQNVSRRELDEYSTKLNEFFSAESNRTALYDSADSVLPAPDIEVPTVEWLQAKQAEVSEIAAKTRHLLNEDGTINQEAVAEDTKKMVSEVDEETTERRRAEGTLTDESTSDDKSEASTEDLGEYKDIPDDEWF